MADRRGGGCLEVAAAYHAASGLLDVPGILPPVPAPEAFRTVRMLQVEGDPLAAPDAVALRGAGAFL